MVFALFRHLFYFLQSMYQEKGLSMAIISSFWVYTTLNDQAPQRVCMIGARELPAVTTR